MSLKLYDEALNDKISSVFSNFIMAPPESAFNRSNQDGKVKLPLISAYRISNLVNFEDYNKFEVFYGRATRGAEEFTKGVPVTIIYQIDIWANFREHADGIYRDLVYYLMHNPNLRVKLPNTDENYYEDFSMKLTDVNTATDYESFEDKNYLHRYSLTYEIDHARMFHQSLKNNSGVPYIKLEMVE